jgi:hypothetical protein
MFQPLKAKILPPNYEFKLNSLDNYMPLQKLSELQEKVGKGAVISDQGEIKSVEFLIKEDRYHLKVLVQHKNDEIFDTFIKLPSYFLHDVFFQSLINKLGKQTTYKKVREEAFYTWVLDNEIHVYSAACTITCFPIFYSVSSKNKSGKSILEQLSN